MISLSGLVSVIVYLLIAAAVLALLWFLVNYAERTFGGPPMVYAVIRFVFVALVVLLLIALLLSFVNHQPMFRA